VNHEVFDGMLALYPH